MTFQDQAGNSIQLPFPHKGINLTSNNDPSSARYLQNVLLGNNNTGKIRYGTNLESSFEFDEDVIHRSIIHGASFLKLDGTYENLVYSTYLILLPFINVADNVLVEVDPDNHDNSILTLDLTDLDDEQKNILKSRIYEGVRIQVIQLGLVDGADITDVTYTENAISFKLPFSNDFFELDAHGHNMFLLWHERAGIYRMDGNVFEIPALVDDLDPNVIVCSVNYQNTLLFTNGVDPVQAYDGNTIFPLAGHVKIPKTGEVVTVGDGNDITLRIKEELSAIYQEVLVIDFNIRLETETTDADCAITNIVFAAPNDGEVLVTITCNIEPPELISNILYKKVLPAFSYIAVGHNRLWALAEGRDYNKQFRSPVLSQKVYFAAKPQSVTDWYDEQTNEIGFLNLSANSNDPENLEVIWFFQGQMLFIGRHSTQLWEGDDPTKDNPNDINDAANFKLKRVFPLGVMQKTLCQEMPNNLAIISNFGQSYSFHLNKYGQIDFIPNFVEPVREYFEFQLAFIDNDRDYREMTSFYYPYSDLIGIKIKNECIVYQNKQEGFWTVFSENFAEAKCFFYNKIDKTLYLGMNQGSLLSYGDKITNRSYTDFDLHAAVEKKISWRIVYSWLNPSTTWWNENLFFSVTSLQNVTININVSINNDETRPILNTVAINQNGFNFDIDNFGAARFAMQPKRFARKYIKFKADSLLLEFNGFVEDSFVFNRAYLTGGADGN